ncbi:serine/threonine-protein kinase [Hyalangium gracile]|uniref:serine/threonine-protein kinase n=1 Tax=Hyalangium gracile TaxID=394092 RepID=UPI001CCF8FF0|nr:serine/threonine-protein kinase [Hyalangium gracile]
MGSKALLTPAHPALLPLDTVVEAWRVVGWAGCGVYGAVYRAVPVHDEHAPPVALKLALHPEDPRFVREGELLSRCRHPSIPRLLGQGSWQSPAGSRHPFLVMEWVDGVPLYEQAQAQPPEPSQVRRWLQQLAEALAVLHAQGAVHRDLKGGNILVRSRDGRAMLMDFGTGLYPGAAPLTPAMRFPGTPIYRSPESWLFEVRFYRDEGARYRPAPADDLYALGVTACRLLTGEYPEPAVPVRDEHGVCHMQGVLLPRALRKSPNVDPALRACTLRLLTVQPEQRGSAEQLARELESTLRPARLRPRHGRRGWALAAAAVALAVGAWAAVPGRFWRERSVAQAERMGAAVGTAGLGDAAAGMVLVQAPAGSATEGMGKDTLPEPLPGQVKPDQKGRCPFKGLVSLNGGCWLTEAQGEPEKCVELGGQMFQGTCYMPLVPPGRKRPPTSGSMKNP